jgi:hypothetical protein
LVRPNWVSNPRSSALEANILTPPRWEIVRGIQSNLANYTQVINGYNTEVFKILLFVSEYFLMVDGGSDQEISEHFPLDGSCMKINKSSWCTFKFCSIQFFMNLDCKKNILRTIAI